MSFILQGALLAVGFVMWFAIVFFVIAAVFLTKGWRSKKWRAVKDASPHPDCVPKESPLIKTAPDFEMKAVDGHEVTTRVIEHAGMLDLWLRVAMLREMNLSVLTYQSVPDDVYPKGRPILAVTIQDPKSGKMVSWPPTAQPMKGKPS